MTLRRILRMPAVIDATGRSRASIYVDIDNGIFPPGVRIGGNAIGWPDDEVAAVNAARIAGHSEEQVRALVADLIAARQQAYTPQSGPPGNRRVRAQRKAELTE